MVNIEDKCKTGTKCSLNTCLSIIFATTASAKTYEKNNRARKMLKFCCKVLCLASNE